MGKQIGPTETISRSCFECTYCRSERYVCQGDSGSNVSCSHPDLDGWTPRERYIGDTTWKTPGWCPAPASRAAPDPQTKE